MGQPLAEMSQDKGGGSKAEIVPGVEVDAAANQEPCGHAVSRPSASL